MRPTIYIASAALLAAACSGGAPTGARSEPRTTSQQPLDVTAPLDAPFTLKVGDWASVAGGALRVGLSAVASDSRCPAGVACVWEGDAALSIRVVIGGRETTATIHTAHGAVVEPRDAEVGGYVISVVALTPEPVAGQEIAASAYRAQLVVRRK